MNSFKGAIIGFGNIAAQGHWPGYAASNDFEIVAVADPSTARQAAARELKTNLRTYATLEDLLQSERLDFVDICTPPSSHVKLTQACVQRGLHVLCEKPLSLHAGDYELLARHVQRSGKTVFTVHNWKYAPIFQTALEFLYQDLLGPVWHVEIFTLRNNVCKGTAQGASAGPDQASEDWRTNRGVAGGGILVDHGWHAFYLLLNLVKADPERVLAKMHVEANDENALEDAVQALVQFPEADGYIHLTWRAKMRRNSMMIQGQKGTILLDDDRLLLTTRSGQRKELAFEPALSAGSHHADWFGGLLPDFLEEIKNPAQRGQNFREAGWCVALTCAAYESNLRGFQEVPVFFPGAPKPAPVVSLT
jgi:predicted dehydrogenase